MKGENIFKMFPPRKLKKEIRLLFITNDEKSGCYISQQLFE
jgi:hypothetical protein